MSGGHQKHLPVKLSSVVNASRVRIHQLHGTTPKTDDLPFFERSMFQILASPPSSWR